MNKNSILKICVVIFFASYLIIGLLVYKDYGISTDEVIQRHHGLVSAKYITSFFNEYKAEELFPRVPNIQDYAFKSYGVVFHLPLTFLEKSLSLEDPRDIWLLRHLCTFLFFYVGTIFFFLLAKQRFNSTLLGLLSVTILVISPRIFADSFYNIKDGVFISAFIISLYFMIKSIETNKVFYIVLFSLSAAFATNIRIIAIILPVLYPFFILMKKDISNIVKEKRDYTIKLYFFGLLYILLVFAFWPASWANPISMVWETISLKANFPWGGHIMYMGNQIKGTETPWHYIPIWIFITTPILYTIFFIFSMGRHIKLATNFLLKRKSIYSLMDNKSWQDLIFATILFLPVVLAIILNSTLYNGWRHFYFIYPVFIIFSVSGVSVLYNYLSDHKLSLCNYLKYFVVLIVFIQITIATKWMQQNHPHQNVYFSSAVDLFGKREGFERDYWQLSLKQALEWLLANKKGELHIVVHDHYNHPEQSSYILKINDRKRIHIYKDIKHNSSSIYLISTHRDEIPNEHKHKKLHSITVDNLPIVSIFKVNI